MNTSPYRRDIDGLRAIAVGSVVISHANLSPYMRGGYVGVDVFFVISGYLISSILFREVTEDRFSIAAFYRRRVLRILPALLAVLVATTVGAFLYMFPTELLDYAKSAIAALLFVSNVYFWSRAGYFDALAMSKPLLHTWSLAIEEQFYIVFPVFLYLVHRFQRNYLRHWVLGIAAISFLIGAYGTFTNPISAFYLVQSRAWELLLGTIVALGIVEIELAPLPRNLATALGLILIVVPVFAYTETTAFPGLAALAPCLGTALIIAAGNFGPTYVSRLLSTRPMVFVGLISYSLYLWHWPLLVFQELGMPFFVFPFQKITHAALVLLAVVLAALSWKFVEAPFRQGRMRAISTPRILAVGAGSLFVFALGLAVVIPMDGFSARFDARATRMASYLNYDKSYFRTGSCFVDSKFTFADFKPQQCLLHDAHKANVLLVGDSHAAHLIYGLAQANPEIAWSQATTASCKTSDPSDLGLESQQCRDMNDYLNAHYLSQHPIDEIVLAGIWNEFDLPAVERSIRYFEARGFKVLLVGPVPRYSVPLPRLMAQSIESGSAAPLNDNLVGGVDSLDARMKALASKLGAGYFSPYRALCDASTCRHDVNGVPVQFDTSHLTREGSLFIGRQIRASGALSPTG
ncbi:MAG TPA: acyltransferase family protein [Rhizomicrobium sp.]